jgi:hypothetical protein
MSKNGDGEHSGFAAETCCQSADPVVALVNLIYWIDRSGGEVFYRPEPTISEQAAGNLMIFVLLMVYCSTGVGLCLWVKRHKISDHWLLRDK